MTLRGGGRIVLTGLALLPACAPTEPERFFFVDVTDAAGLGEFRQVNGDSEKPFIVETVGGGVALFDYDGDGDLDAYLSNGGSLGVPIETNPSDALFANDGNGRFDDTSRFAGIDERRWTNGVRTVDLDGDGWLDVFLTNYGRNTFYRNRGDRTFEDVTAALSLGDERWSTGASFFDVDRDGDLDLYVGNYVEFDEPWMLEHRPSTEYRGVKVMKGPRGLPAAPDRFHLNGGDGTMRDESEAFGILDEPERFAFQTVAFDADGDGWLDLFVANDSVANSLWFNRGGERFENRAQVSGAAFSMGGKPQAGMGVGLGDYDGDGQPDLFLTNFADDYFTVYRGLGGGSFLDRTPALGLGKVTTAKLGWGCGFSDFDNDGDLELFAVNAHVYPQVDRFDLGTVYAQENQLFRFDGNRFIEPEGRAGPGFSLRKASRGAAVGDIDGDGDLDLLIGNIDGAPTLLRNDSPTGESLRVVLVGSLNSRSTIGSSVTIRCGEERQTRWVVGGESFLSSSEEVLHFGLGTSAVVDELTVVWPDGQSESFAELQAGQTVRVVRGRDGVPSRLDN